MDGTGGGRKAVTFFLTEIWRAKVCQFCQMDLGNRPQSPPMDLKVY